MFRKTTRNFNLPAATCGKVCVAEVEEIVPVGSLDPDCIHLPSIYVNRLILGSPYEKKIEFRTVRQHGGRMIDLVPIAGAVAQHSRRRPTSPGSMPRSAPSTR